MRSALRLIAVLPLALLLLAGCTPTASTSTSKPEAPATVNPDVQVTRTVALKVPNMHCPHGCWPSVEKTLASEPGVGSVKLAAQKEEGAIDNPVVYVGVDEKFDAEHAIAALAESGFKESVEVKE
jgi:copper chaperone CopZ